ncbi:MAG TPA: V-type ATPase subunit [Clostridia bacterium]|jgi:vacuolar-type H+-ATPase subunit C/Vma6|nr:V-type ATPase subunit [Clostridia bacterium]
MKEGLLFANGRAKAKENNFISEERIRRMQESKSLDEAVRILFEINYAGGMMVEPDDFYSILVEEERLLYEFMHECAPKDIGLECFFLRADYHNLKVLCKEQYGNISDADKLLSPYGLISVAKIKEQFKEMELENTHMREAFDYVNNLFEEGNLTPRVIDVVIDKAMFRDIKERLSKHGIDKAVIEYFKVLTDLTNILTFLRTIKIEAGYEFFESNFVEGGSLTLEFFAKLDDKEKLEKELKGTEYRDFYDSVKDADFASYETEQDNYLLKIFATKKADMLSAAPIVGYYLGKLNEIKIVRVILVCKKNNVPKVEMEKRIRQLYI